MNMSKNFMVASYEAEANDNNLTKFIKSAMADSDKVNKVAPSLHNAGTYYQLGELLDMAKKDALTDEVCYNLISELVDKTTDAETVGNYDVAERLDGMVDALDMVVDYLNIQNYDMMGETLQFVEEDDYGEEEEEYVFSSEELRCFKEAVEDANFYCTCE